MACPRHLPRPSRRYMARPPRPRPTSHTSDPSFPTEGPLGPLTAFFIFYFFDQPKKIFFSPYNKLSAISSVSESSDTNIRSSSPSNPVLPSRLKMCHPCPRVLPLPPRSVASALALIDECQAFLNPSPACKCQAFLNPSPACTKYAVALFQAAAMTSVRA